MRDHDDDQPIGRVLSRREAVRLLGTGSAAAAFLGVAGLGVADAWQTPARAPGCVVRPEQTEGPYFVDQQLSRPDIRSEPSTGMAKPGERLALALTINDVTGGQCRPLQDAIVDVWQCDAQGIYSGVQDGRVGFNTVGQKFLRGVQTTNAKGVALFTTIYPGWYPGRTVHIHFKVRTKTAGGAYEFTSQWYFDEALNERILADPRYAKPGRRDRTNATDSLYRNGGDQLLLAPTTTADGLAASYTIGLDLADAAVGRPDGGRGRGRGGDSGRARTRTGSQFSVLRSVRGS